MTIAQTIRAEAERHGLTQRELATRLGISEAYTSDICTGKRSISAFVALRLETVLSLDAATILARQGEEELAQARKAWGG